jgi:hypothetical protein
MKTAVFETFGAFVIRDLPEPAVGDVSKPVPLAEIGAAFVALKELKAVKYLIQLH